MFLHVLECINYVKQYHLTIEHFLTKVHEEEIKVSSHPSVYYVKECQPRVNYIQMKL